ncbi:MAG TPA: 30S ribosome-binding factor RbfA [Candidatus Brocadiia bacterium]|nr:30S ribosome-binding factor RbfA [Planctomycetota bacterium]MBI4007322.1 30S ribosome-binding factor RbfA [Planctomycetota bacterium]MDO8092698.1 30S ribosome-binding factor RbfA [Candidatus Brocadiales bacterium]
MVSRRVKRVEEAIRQEVSKIVLYELKDPRIAFLTITNVEASPDLRTAKVLISILGDEVSQKTVLRGLEHARGYIQREIATRLKMRYTPVITFCLDKSLKKSLHVLKLIDEVTKEKNEIRYDIPEPD